MRGKEKASHFQNETLFDEKKKKRKNAIRIRRGRPHGPTSQEGRLGLFVQRDGRGEELIKKGEVNR